jgi:hypothetical protein
MHTIVLAQEGNYMASIIYKGTRYYIQTTGKYYSSRNPVQGTRSLHRRIWIEHHGSIPVGMDIHHIDGDWKNNDISNLKCVEESRHLSKHTKASFRNKEYRKAVEAGRQKAIKAAVAWHRSAEGKEWHSQHGKEAWIGRKKFIVKCATCGKPFKASFKRAKHCSKSCTNRYTREHSKRVQKKCPICGKLYQAKIADAKKTVCCGRSCGAKWRWQNERGARI